MIAEHLGVDPGQVTEGASLVDDLGADSIATYELVNNFEQEFDINIPDEDAEKIQSVGDILKYIDEHAK